MSCATRFTIRFTSGPYAVLGSRAAKFSSPPTSETCPTFWVAHALERHTVPPDSADRSRTARSTLIVASRCGVTSPAIPPRAVGFRSEEHTSELQSQSNLVCRLLLEKKKKQRHPNRVLRD